MARPKEFDREATLEKAMRVFWAKGYEGTSTDDLLRGMKIGRQSMYDTFGDKHSLYLESLKRYSKRMHDTVFSALQTASSPLEALREVLNSIAKESEEERELGCMGVNSATEFGTRDAEVHAIRQSSGQLCEELVMEMVREAKCAGELPAALDELPAARFILLTRTGLRVSAKAGATREALLEMAEFAISRLRG